MIFLIQSGINQLFFYRLVFGMGFDGTRVEHRGKTVLTISKKVQDLINGLDTFHRKLDAATNMN